MCRASVRKPNRCVCMVWPNLKKSKGSPYSIAESKVPELIPVLGSQPAGDVSHKPVSRLPLLSTRPAVTPATLKRAATDFAAWWTEARLVWTVCLRLFPDSVAAAIWTRALLCLSPARWPLGYRTTLVTKFMTCKYAGVVPFNSLIGMGNMKIDRPANASSGLTKWLYCDNRASRWLTVTQRFITSATVSMSSKWVFS